MQAISVLASSLRASTHHGGGYWVVPSSSRVLFFVTMRPWCFRHLLWGVGLMWVLGCPVVIVVGCWGCSRSRSGDHLTISQFVGFKWISATVRIYTDSGVQVFTCLHRSSDTPLPPLKPPAENREQKASLPMWGRGKERDSMGMCKRGSFRADTCN